MEFPEDILLHIRGFAKPFGTRIDWRTCKLHESNVIRVHNRFTLSLSWHHYIETRAMAHEIAEWTLYGRQRALQHLIQWTPGPPSEDWYETRIRTYDWRNDELATATSTS